MKSKDLQPLKMSLHGMDERMQKMMANYFKLPCRGTAIVTDDSEAHAEIVDVDLAPSKTLLEERLAHKPSKPIIALSLNEISASGVIYVKKPISVPDVLAAFGLTREVLLGKTSLEKPSKPADTPSETAKPDSTEESTPPAQKKPKTSKQKQPKSSVQEKPKAYEQKQSTPIVKQKQITTEKSKDVPDVITQALQKANAKSYLTPQQKALNEKVALDYDTKQRADKNRQTEKLEQPKQQEPVNEVQISPEKTVKKSEIKPSPEHQQPAPLKQSTVDQPISTEKIKTTDPDKYLPFEKERPIKPALAEKLSTTQSSSSFLDTILQRKGLIAGLTCLFTLLAGIFIFQLTPIYEARARIFISDSNVKDIPADPSSVENILDLAVAQEKIEEIVSRQLAGHTIKTLKLDTIPEFIAAAEELNQASESTLRQERQTAEQFSSMTDYFLQNLKASQFRNSPIINIDYKSEDPKVAAKVATQLANNYVAMQRDKKIEMENQIADWENNKLPAAKNKVKQSQDALELYIEMNKWSQFEQQFAEDMGVNSEIRALEKKLKADLSLYEIFLTRFENLKKDTNVVEVKLISSAEIPADPSSPNKIRLLLIALLSAFIIAIIIAYILSALNNGRETVSS